MIKAISDRVFIRLDKKQDKTEGGIILAEDYHSSRTVGTIESIGSEVTSVHVGDRVLFHIWDELPTYDKDIVVVRENSILGVFEDE